MVRSLDIDLSNEIGRVLELIRDMSPPFRSALSGAAPTEEEMVVANQLRKEAMISLRKLRDLPIH